MAPYAHTRPYSAMVRNPEFREAYFAERHPGAAEKVGSRDGRRLGDQFIPVCRSRLGLPLDTYMTKENVRTTRMHEQRARVRGERISGSVNLNAGGS